LKHLIYIFLKRAKGVRKAKGGNKLFVKAIVCSEGSLLFVPLSNSKAVEYSNNIEFSKLFSLS